MPERADPLTLRLLTTFEARLRSAGLVIGASPGAACPRCELYAAHLRRHLP